MIYVEKKKDCCGCGACVQACPRKCISFHADKEGFLYPQTDKKCVDCGLCEKACPMGEFQKNSEEVLKSCAAYSLDDGLRKKSSSGGMFTVFADRILENGGVVYGAAFDDKFLVHHIGIEHRDELFKLQGSKYLQSRTENTFKQARENLNAGRQVLYTGTACQVAGLKKFLGKDYKDLYTIDVLCHGVPSPDVWERYLAEQEENYGASVGQVFFRNKNSGWKTYSLTLQFNNSAVYGQVFQKDLFMQMFLGDICLRPSCHDCKFKSLKRDSDITIGDAWGIENHSPEMDDNKGVSVVMVHSEKGLALFDAIRDEIRIKDVDKDILLPPSADSRKSVLPHKNREKFFEMLNQDVSCKRLKTLMRPGFLKRGLNLLRRIRLNLRKQADQCG